MSLSKGTLPHYAALTTVLGGCLPVFTVSLDAQKFLEHCSYPTSLFQFSLLLVLLVSELKFDAMSNVMQPCLFSSKSCIILTLKVWIH